MPIQFCSKEHQEFFRRSMVQCKTQDAYHQALFYTMGIAPDTRSHVSSWFDFTNDAIRPDALEKGWQTGGTTRLTRLAFNLWNGFDDGRSNPYDMFDCSYALYMLEGIKMRYPEYCHEIAEREEDYEL